MAHPTPHVALLRGINVVGKNLLPMKSLAALGSAAGLTRVATHIQSGNLLFLASPAAVRALPKALTQAIAAAHGLQIPVLTRSLEQMLHIVADNPFAGDDPRLLYVSFLSAAPTAKQIASLDPQRSPPDELSVRGDVVYLRLPNGAGKTKMTNAWLERRLGCVSTTRNWAVTQKLTSLLEAMSSQQ